MDKLIQWMNGSMLLKLGALLMILGLGQSLAEAKVIEVQNCTPVDCNFQTKYDNFHEKMLAQKDSALSAASRLRCGEMKLYRNKNERASERNSAYGMTFYGGIEIKRECSEQEGCQLSVLTARVFSEAKGWDVVKENRLSREGTLESKIIIAQECVASCHGGINMQASDDEGVSDVKDGSDDKDTSDNEDDSINIYQKAQEIESANPQINWYNLSKEDKFYKSSTSMKDSPCKECRKDGTVVYKTNGTQVAGGTGCQMCQGGELVEGCMNGECCGGQCTQSGQTCCSDHVYPAGTECCISDVGGNCKACVNGALINDDFDDPGTCLKCSRGVSVPDDRDTCSDPCVLNPICTQGACVGTSIASNINPLCQ